MEEHADRRGGRYRDQQAEEAEEQAEGEQREEQPHRVQADAGADQVGLQDIAFEHLAGHEDGDGGGQPDPVRPELDDGDDDRGDEAAGEAEIGDEAQYAGGQADEQAVVEADGDQAGGIEDAEHRAGQHLAAHEGGDLLVHGAGEPADLVGVVARQQPVDPGDHAVPVAQQVEDHEGGDEEQRGDVDHRAPAGEQRGQQRLHDAGAVGEEAGQRGAQARRVDAEIARPVAFQPRTEHRLQARDQARQLLQEIGELVDQHRHDEDEDGDEENEDDHHHDERRDVRLIPRFSSQLATGSRA